MDKIKNPFSPGAGSPPRELAGRNEVLEQADILLKRVQNRRSEKSLVLTGLRGVGKTVLLNEIEHFAREAGCRTILLEAHEGKSLPILLVQQLRGLLFELDRIKGTGNKVRRALAVLKSFVNTIKLKVGEFEIGVDLEPLMGIADSGDLELDLPNLFTAVAEAAAERGTLVVILIDEIQYCTLSELSALIMAMHKMQQRSLPLIMIAAGLPILPGLMGNSKSYAERLFHFPIIGPLSEEDANLALRQPVQREGVDFEPQALHEVYRLTQGYPYFLQEWGYQAWNHAEGSSISLKTIHKAHDSVVQRLDENFFRVRFDRLTPREKKYLSAMAELGSGPYKTGEIGDKLNTSANLLGPVRASLIRKGMIYSSSHGEMAFTVPMFDEFMRRTVSK